MQHVTKQLSFVSKLATLTAVLLFSQQAMAVGTPAGITISNTATVDYKVGNVDQTPIVSLGADFVVDNRVDMTLSESGLVGRTIVTPGQVNNWVEFTLLNTGNQSQGYQLNPTALATPDFQMLNIQAFAETDGIPGWTAADTDTVIDTLAANTSRVVYIVAEAPTGLTDGDLSDVTLTAVTTAAGTGAAVALAGTTGADTAGEDVVLAVGNVFGEGTATATDGYIVELIALSIVKNSTLISDPISTGTDGPFAIPGAVVAYDIVVTNPSATTSTTAVRVSDTLTEVLVTAGATITLTNATLGGVAAASCTADVGDGDGDGCGIDQVTSPQVLSVGNANADFTIAPTESLTIVFDTTIQ